MVTRTNAGKALVRRVQDAVRRDPSFEGIVTAHDIAEIEVDAVRAWLKSAPKAVRDALIDTAIDAYIAAALRREPAEVAR